MYKHCPGAAIQMVYLRSQGVFLGWTDGFVGCMCWNYLEDHPI